jgi:hypothetical protein
MPTGTGRPAIAPRAGLAVLAAALLAPALAAAADVSIQARVDQTAIALDDLITLEIRLESPVPPSKLELPESPDFEQLPGGTEEHEPLISLGGGGGVQIRTALILTRQLRPKRAGALTIPSVTAVVRGHTYATQPIAVKVSAAAVPRGPSAGAGAAPSGPGSRPAPPRGGWAYRGWEKDVSLRAEVERREVWLGEQVPVGFWLLVPFQMEAYGNASPPRFDGFWQEVLETPRTPVSEPHGDKLGYLLRRIALFPARTGELTIDPFELRDVTIPVRGSLDPLGGAVRLDRKSEPVTLRVKPLPPDPPPGFEPGNVGALALEVKAAPERVAVGEPIMVRVTLSGDGNVRALAPPRLPEIYGARAFPPTITDRTEVRQGRFFGSRTAETVLVPDRPGELVVPGLTWSFFDPHAGKYQVAMAPALRIAVAAVAAAPAGPAGPAGRIETEAAGAGAAGGLHGIRAQGDLRPAGPPPWQRRWFLALLLVPPLAFLGAGVAGRLRGDDAARASRGVGRGARRALAGARRRLERDPAGAIGELERALLGYAGGRLRRPAAGLTREELADALTRAGAHPPAVRALLAALELVDAARYGAGDVLGEEVLTAAERALDALDEADWQPDREVGT